MARPSSANASRPAPVCPAGARPFGEWVQEWRFKAQGLTLNMASQSKGGAKTVLAITAEAPSKLATARGIRIGSTIAEMTKA